MASWLVPCPQSAWSGFKPWPGILLCSWARHLTLTDSASLHPRVQMSTGELLGIPNKLQGSDL